ncbi:MAG TPA: FMN-binding protein [Pseudolysinimonas sp.]|nr:FMN-binding protein [Pseudolysinimonas sp.]
MRRRAAVASVIASAGVIIAGFQIGSAVSATRTTTSAGLSGGTATSTGGSAAASPGATASPAPTAATGSTGSAQDGTFTGATEQTPFGPMQVAAVISGGKITDVKVLQRTDQGGRSVQISNQADPMLRSEVLQSQSANVSMIGGATYTSEGYLMSLQSALDKAGFTG